MHPMALIDPTSARSTRPAFATIGGAGGASIATAFADLETQLGGAPHLVWLAAANAAFDTAVDDIARRWPKAACHAFTSCMGGMTVGGFHGADANGFALAGLRDPDGAFGVGTADPGDSREGAFRAGRTAAICATSAAGRPGEVPKAVLLACPPGHDAAVLAGVISVLGEDVPVQGGGAADDDVAGSWRVLEPGTGARGDRVAVTVLHPTCEVAEAVHDGYAPAGPMGTVTRARGRVLEEIDGEPAARVYDRWTGGTIRDLLAVGGPLLHRTTLRPFGLAADGDPEQDGRILMHPERVTPDGALHLFAEVEPGQPLMLMRGSRRSLVQRAGRPFATAIYTAGFHRGRTLGGLMSYCAGCLFAVGGERAAEVVTSAADGIDGAPFAAAFTFGEFGAFQGGRSRHGNLLFSVLTFGERTPCT